MTIQMQGTITGRHILLHEEVGLPEGTTVNVEIRPQALSLEEKRRLATALCGAWADDPSIGPIFAEIEQQRAASLPRQEPF